MQYTDNNLINLYLNYCFEYIHVSNFQVTNILYATDTANDTHNQSHNKHKSVSSSWHIRNQFHNYFVNEHLQA